MFSGSVLYRDYPRYDKLTKIMVGVVVASTLIVGFVMLPFDLAGAMVMFGVTLLDGFIMWSILPRRFDVLENGLKIILHGPFSMFIPFPDVKRFKHADKEAGYVYWGIRLTTSGKYLIEIDRKNGMNVIFSPSREDEFLEELNRAKDQYREPDLSVFENMFK